MPSSCVYYSMRSDRMDISKAIARCGFDVIEVIDSAYFDLAIKFGSHEFWLLESCLPIKGMSGLDYAALKYHAAGKDKPTIFLICECLGYTHYAPGILARHGVAGCFHRPFNRETARAQLRQYHLIR